ncbi:MAG: putative Ig domain-containing protein [Phycisphaerae bacterium]
MGTKRFPQRALILSAAGAVFSSALGAAHASGTAADIRTPAAPATPRVNGPTIFGVTPDAPFFYKIPATGAGTVTYSVDQLPAGLSVNPANGVITGSLSKPGEYTVTLKAANALGTATKSFRIEVGTTIELTPALGWNSWNVWGGSETAAKWQQAADAMASTGLINYGWSYVNNDDYWQGARGGPYNALQGNANFLAGGYTMQGVVDHIHSLGLKAGIYSTPWVQSYGGFPGSSSDNANGSWTKQSSPAYRHDGAYSFIQNDANQWAAWGIDYLKYDWNPAQNQPTAATPAQFHAETAAMGTALKVSGRDIVYSYSNSMPFARISDQAPMLNSWRITGDITDSWSSMSSKGFNQDKWAPYVSPGHWIDPDMLEVGYVGKSANPHLTHLTADEQYTHITLWSMLSAPLLLGCDLTRMDAFTLNLLTNPEVLAVDQDALGIQALRKSSITLPNGDNLQVYEKPLEDGTIAVALFNLGSSTDTVTANWSSLGINGNFAVRDLWREQDLGFFSNSFSMSVASHSAELIKISVPEPASLLSVTAALPLVLGRRKRARTH